MTQSPNRPDMDILQDIQTILATYPPLAADRHNVHIAVQGGVVALEGHVKTPITRLYLLERAAAVPGVIGLTVDELHDDESIRLSVGPLLPHGVMANAMFGVVVLSGARIGDVTEDIVQQASQIPGVVRVVVVQNTPAQG